MPGALGIGFINFCLEDATLDAAVACKPHAIWLAFPSEGHDHSRFAPRIQEAGIKLIVMVQTLEQADAAVRMIMLAPAMRSSSEFKAGPLLSLG